LARTQVDAHHHDGNGRSLGHEQHHAVEQDLAIRKRTRKSGSTSQGSERDAERQATESHGHPFQSSVFLNLSTASEKMTTPKMISGMRLGHR